MTTELRPYPALSPEQSAFWARLRAETGETASGPRFIDAFGDSPDLMDELLGFVLSGRKRATASLARWYDDATRPEPGDLALILDGRGAPACVIRTTAVRIGPVHSVTDEDAYEEGEYEATRARWLFDHRAYYRREAEREGFEYSDDLDVLFERFELVWAP
ncbi:MAG: ASCH domain-containing protein [Oceanicaulis sp.]